MHVHASRIENDIAREEQLKLYNRGKSGAQKIGCNFAWPAYLQGSDSHKEHEIIQYIDLTQYKKG